MSLPGPVDLDHLSRYTGGDAKTNAEILALFLDQSREIMSRLEVALARSDVKAWRETAHSLKGGARGIGAFQVADAAADVEAADIAADAMLGARLLDDLKSRMQVATLFIEAYLRR